MTTYKTPFGDMAHGDKISVPLPEWEAKTGVKATNDATFPLKGGTYLRLFNVNEPALLVVEQVGVECVVARGYSQEEFDASLTANETSDPDPDDDPDIA